MSGPMRARTFASDCCVPTTIGRVVSVSPYRAMARSAGFGMLPDVPWYIARIMYVTPLEFHTTHPNSARHRSFLNGIVKPPLCQTAVESRIQTAKLRDLALLVCPWKSALISCPHVGPLRRRSPRPHRCVCAFARPFARACCSRASSHPSPVRCRPIAPSFNSERH